MKFFILFVAAYAGAAKHKASGQIVQYFTMWGLNLKYETKKNLHEPIKIKHRCQD